ncbi:hypothetical protein [Microcoleus sp.]|uniref:hypothetical protein n=1 Tax=Microcoleus sp. TaxID=44472 RepID=UPI00359428AF
MGIGRSEAEGLGIGHWALGGAKRRDWELGIGRSEAEGLGIGHWALGILGLKKTSKVLFSAFFYK